MNEDAYSYNILCLEDNFPEIEQAMRALQKKLKARIYIAGNYAEAEKLLSARHFDLFILDIEMKGERSTGIQLAESVRTMHLYSTVPPPFFS